MANDQSSIAAGYDDFLRELKERIPAPKCGRYLHNRELVLLYWQIGRDILTRQQQQWGAVVTH